MASTTATAEPLKIGFVYVSPIGEAGWTWQQDIGRREMEQALGDKVKTQYVEDVPEGADAERVIRDLAQQGNKLIFTTSFGYMNPKIKVDKQFPDVKRSEEHKSELQSLMRISYAVLCLHKKKTLT